MGATSKARDARSHHFIMSVLEDVCEEGETDGEPEFFQGYELASAAQDNSEKASAKPFFVRPKSASDGASLASFFALVGIMRTSNWLQSVYPNDMRSMLVLQFCSTKLCMLLLQNQHDDDDEVVTDSLKSNMKVRVGFLVDSQHLLGGEWSLAGTQSRSASH